MAQPQARPMPRRLSKDAPSFNGKRIEDFMTEFEALAANASLTNADKCKWMAIYSKGSAHEVVSSLKEIEDGNWTDAKALLLHLYKARDSKKHFNNDSLRRYTHKRRVIRRRAEFDAYHRGFLVIYNPLKKKDIITDRERDHRFYTGLPKSLRKLIKEELKSKKKWDNTKPPEINDVITEARDMLKDDAYHEDQTDEEGDEPDTEEEASVTGSSDSEDEDFESEYVKKHTKEPSKPVKTKKKPKYSRSKVTPTETVKDEVDDLTEKLQKLRLELAEVSSSIRREPKREFLQENRIRVCYMCGEERAHKGGVRSCPETISLIRSGLIQYNEEGRLSRTNAEDMPYHKIEGGMAKAIKESIKKKNKGKGSAIANLKLEEDGESPFRLGHVYALDAEYDEPRSYRPTVYEVTKSERDKKKSRIDQLKKPGGPSRIPKPGMRPEVVITSGPKFEKSKNVTEKPVKRLPEQIPPSQIRFQEPITVMPQQSIRDDVEMVEGAPRKFKPKQFRYTTEVQDSVQVQDVFQKIMDQPVNVSVRELLGTSVGISKLLQEATKTQRKLIVSEVPEGNKQLHKANRVFYYRTDDETDYETDDEEEEEEEVQEPYYVRKASAQMDPYRFLAMATGKFTGHVGSQEVEMLIDTGSELNLMSADIQTDLNLPMDPTVFKNWTLKGINGSPVPLKGICREVPVRIGGLRFDHHFFVTQEDSIGYRRVVLGQPFMNYHAMAIEYHPDEGMVAQLWNHGRRSNPSVRVTVAKLNDERNVHSQSARILKSMNLEIKWHSIGNKRGNNRMLIQDGSEITPLNLLRKNELKAVPRLGSSLYESLGLVQGTTQSAVPPNIDFLNQNLIKSGGINSYIPLLRAAWNTTENVHQEGIREHLFRILKSKGTKESTAVEMTDQVSAAINGAKYKKVALKHKPVAVGDPNAPIPQFKEIELGTLSDLPSNPLPIEDFPFTEKFTRERVNAIMDSVPKGFLKKAEMELLMHVVGLHQKAFAYSSKERGVFNEEYFPDYVIRTVPHTPWEEKPIRFPRATEVEIIKIIKERQQGGVYEPSQSAYRSKIFVVEKKGGTLRVVHDLQKLNSITIRDAGLPPRVDAFAEEFAGYSIYGIADLYSGYDACTLAKESRHLTSFHAYGLGPQQLTCLPQGFTNSVIEFCRRTFHIIKGMSDRAGVFVDDIAVKGPPTLYNNEPILENPNIRRFVWEYAHTLHELLSRIEVAGVTVSGKKFVLATPELELVGRIVSIDGQQVSHGTMSKIMKWKACGNVS